MTQKFKRYVLFHLNRFQRGIIICTVLAFVLGCALAWATLVYMFFSSFPSPRAMVVMIKEVFPWVIVGILALVIFLLIWVCTLTNRIVGPYERVVREMDEMLEGKKPFHPIGVRHGDTLFEELARRINAMIERMKP